MCNSREINQNLILLINSTIFVLFRVFFIIFVLIPSVFYHSAWKNVKVQFALCKAIQTISFLNIFIAIIKEKSQQ